MSLFRYDLICEHCGHDYFVIARIEQDPTFCSFCGELQTQTDIIPNDEDELAV